MKRIFSLLLVFALVLSIGVTVYATEGIEGGEQPQEPEQQTTVTVSSLEELETAIATAEDGDSIAISTEIMLDGVALETDSDITLVRADTYESGSFFRLKNSAVLSGFTMENYKSSATVVCDSAAEIKHCSFVGDVEITESFIKAYMLFSKADVVISDCSFSGALYSAIRSNQNAQLSITNSTFSNNSSYAQGGAIHSSGTLILDNCTFTGNKAVSGGGVYCSGNLTITDCQFSGNQIESEKFGTDILSMGTLSITDDPQDGAGYFEESTGEKVSLPLADYTSTAKLILLTDEQAAVYFAPVQDEPEEEPAPDDETPIEPPTTPSEPPQDDNGDDTPDDQQPPSEPQEKPNDDDNADISEDDNEPEIIYRPIYVHVPVYIERDPEPVEPSFVCGDAVIDVFRSVVLEGYDDGLLHLEDGLTRAQFMTILYRLLDEDTLDRYESTDTVFGDVSPDAWYCCYVSTIANAGIVCGTGNGSFDPEGVLTWAHIVIILSRFVEPQEYDLQNIQYDGWAADAVETAVALGWITDHAAFNPDAPISRGELAYFVNFVLSLYR